MTNHAQDDHAPDDLVALEVQRSLFTALKHRAGTSAPGPVRLRRAAVALGAASAVAVAVVAFSAAGPSDGPLDVVAKASAVLSPPEELLHYTATAGPVAASGGLDPAPIKGSCAESGSIEVWQTTVPDRWRAILRPNPRGAQCSRAYDPNRDAEITGPTEMAWDRGTTSRYQPASDTLDIVRGYPSNSDARDIPLGDQRLGTGDPVSVVRSLLASGAVRETERSTVDGRTVRVLRGTTEATDGDRTTTVKVLYAIDADSFAPVRAITTTSIQDPDVHPALRARLAEPRAQQLDFTSYERRPLTPQSEQQLAIRPARPTQTVDQTLAEFEEAIRQQG